MLLEVKDLNISLTSEKSVAEHISFRLGQGEMLSIVGSSGAGKTTICKAIMGLLGNTYRADGEILFQGEDLLDLPELDGALQSITGLLYPSSIRTVRRRTKAGGNRQGTGR